MTINFYLNCKPDKKGFDNIMLRVICDKQYIKNSTGIKVRSEDFDKEKQPSLVWLQLPTTCD